MDEITIPITKSKECINTRIQGISAKRANMAVPEGEAHLHVLMEETKYPENLMVF